MRIVVLMVVLVLAAVVVVALLLLMVLVLALVLALECRSWAAGENLPWSDQTPEGFSCGPRVAVFIPQQQERTLCQLPQAMHTLVEWENPLPSILSTALTCCNRETFAICPQHCFNSV